MNFIFGAVFLPNVFSHDGSYHVYNKYGRRFKKTTTTQLSKARWLMDWKTDFGDIKMFGRQCSGGFDQETERMSNE